MSSLFRIKRKDLTRLIVGVFTLTAKGLHFSQIAMRIFLTLIEYLVMSLLSLTRPGLPRILTANLSAMTEHLNLI